MLEYCVIRNGVVDTRRRRTAFRVICKHWNFMPSAIRWSATTTQLVYLIWLAWFENGTAISDIAVGNTGRHRTIPLIFSQWPRDRYCSFINSVSIHELWEILNFLIKSISFSNPPYFCYCYCCRARQLFEAPTTSTLLQYEIKNIHLPQYLFHLSSEANSRSDADIVDFANAAERIKTKRISGLWWEFCDKN